MGHQPWTVNKLNQLQLKTVYQFRFFSLEGARLKWGGNPWSFDENLFNSVSRLFKFGWLFIIKFQKMDLYTWNLSWGYQQKNICSVRFLRIHCKPSSISWENVDCYFFRQKFKLNRYFFNQILSIEHDFPNSSLHIEGCGPPSTQIRINNVVGISPRVRNRSRNLHRAISLNLRDGLILFGGQTLSRFLLIHKFAQFIYYEHVFVLVLAPLGCKVGVLLISLASCDAHLIVPLTHE